MCWADILAELTFELSGHSVWGDIWLELEFALGYAMNWVGFWIESDKKEEILVHNKIKKVTELSPSSLDFQINKCHRCFYLSKKLGIQTNNFPPPVFNQLDLIQKSFFINKDTSFISEKLSKGRFLQENELPKKKNLFIKINLIE